MRKFFSNTVFISVASALGLAFTSSPLLRLEEDTTYIFEYVAENAINYYIGEGLVGEMEGSQYECNEHATKKCIVVSFVPPINGVIAKSSGAFAGPAQREFVDLWPASAGDPD